ncbi:hypothetical protein, partial [Phascolarctobacterium faecium]
LFIWIIFAILTYFLCTLQDIFITIKHFFIILIIFITVTFKISKNDPLSAAVAKGSFFEIR